MDLGEQPVCQALVRALDAAGVRFVRYMGLDACGTVRCKVVPLAHIKRSRSLKNQVSIARVCIAGMPPFVDVPVEASGLTTKGCDVLNPDLATLRVLPYAKGSAVLLGNFVSQETGETSDLCCRGLLQHILSEAATTHKISYNVGAEIEFVLFEAGSNMPVDQALFGNTVALNNRDSYISDLYEDLLSQEIAVEQIHAESAPGQFEVVLPHSKDPVSLADDIVLTKETISSVASSHGLKAVFLPKIIEDQAGNGLHLHLSVNCGSDSSPLVSQDGKIKGTTGAFMEGILRHIASIMALSMPSSNSFNRVGPECWTGSCASWGFDDKEQPLRVVRKPGSNEWDHFEFKLVDNSANIYLALVGLIVAGTEGIRKNWSLRQSNETKKLPSEAMECMAALDRDKLFSEKIPGSLLRGVIATRTADIQRHKEMTLDDEVNEHLALFA